MNVHSKIETENGQPASNGVGTMPMDGEEQPRRTGRYAAIGVIALLIAGGVAWRVAGPAGNQPPAMPQATVGVAAPLQRDVQQWDDYIGRFAASKAVEVRPRVSGQIVALHFRDGQFVQQGQALFTIDQRPYRAALAEAEADAASARSAVALARADYGRVRGLTGDDAVSASEVDSLRAKVQATEAALAAAQARVSERALDLSFTTVRAPIAGRISDRRIDVGNLVTGNNGADATLLTTINATSPIYFTFDASEALFLKAQRDRQAGKPATTVQVRLQDEADYRWTGTLDFTDNGIDPRSGTIRGRATFANPGNFLTPGMFGNMRLTSGGTVPALLVPDTVIQSDQARKVVMIAAPDGTVTAKPVQLGPLVDGLRIIKSGLSIHDRVIVSNILAALPGTKVSVKADKITPQAPPPGESAVDAPAAAQASFAR